MYRELLEKTADLFKPASDKDVAARTGKQYAALMAELKAIKGLEILKEPEPRRLNAFWYDGEIAKLGDYILFAVGDISVGFAKQEEESEGFAEDTEWLSDHEAVNKAYELGMYDVDIDSLEWRNNNWFEVGKIVKNEDGTTTWEDARADVAHDYREGIDLLIYVRERDARLGEGTDLFKPAGEEDIAKRNAARPPDQCEKCGGPVRFHGRGEPGVAEYNVCNDCGAHLCDNCTSWVGDGTPYCHDCEARLTYDANDLEEAEDIFKPAGKEEVYARRMAKPPIYIVMAGEWHEGTYEDKDEAIAYAKKETDEGMDGIAVFEVKPGPHMGLGAEQIYGEPSMLRKITVKDIARHAMREDIFKPAGKREIKRRDSEAGNRLIATTVEWLLRDVLGTGARPGLHGRLYRFQLENVLDQKIRWGNYNPLTPEQRKVVINDVIRKLGDKAYAHEIKEAEDIFQPASDSDVKARAKAKSDAEAKAQAEREVALAKLREEFPLGAKIRYTVPKDLPGDEQQYMYGKVTGWGESYEEDPMYVSGAMITPETRGPYGHREDWSLDPSRLKVLGPSDEMHPYLKEADIFQPASDKEVATRDKEFISKDPTAYAPYSKDRQYVEITCPNCGATEDHPKDEQRWHTQHFTYLDQFHVGESDYTRYECNACKKTFKIQDMFGHTPVDHAENMGPTNEGKE